MMFRYSELFKKPGFHSVTNRGIVPTYYTEGIPVFFLKTCYPFFYKIYLAHNPFHKFLPFSAALVHWEMVRNYETGVI